MKIVSLGVENIKRVVALQIEPDGNLVQITGKNGNGKTSVLDSIWWALAGKKPIQSKPIRDGADTGSITLVLGDPKSEDPAKRRELVIMRTFEREEAGSYTTKLRVTNAEGWTPKGGGQSMLDEMIGALSFDPLAFANMDAAHQFDALKQFVPGFDFEANSGQRDVVFERRTGVNTLAKQATAAAALIVMPANTPEDSVDDSALVDELQRANDHNAQLERRKTNREGHVVKIDSIRREASLLAEQAAEMRRQAAELDARAAQKDREAATLQEQYDTAEPLPAPVDVAEIRTRIAGAKEINAAVQKRADKNKHLQIAEKYRRESDELTAQLAELEHAKLDAIAKAHMPIDGLSLGDKIVLFKGNPLDQASDSDRLRVSVAIAAASEPVLRVIRVRRASDFDTNGMRLLGELADHYDMQVWAERVDESGDVGFVIEDGRLKGQVLPAPAGSANEPAFDLTSPEKAPDRRPARKRWQGPGAATGEQQ